MASALILYGSRARGEARAGSDLDLILAEDGMSLGHPRAVQGVSVHLYSKDWLEAEARAGSLFTYHVAYEGIALHDDSEFMERLRQAFRKKASYRNEIEIAALVLRILIERDWADSLHTKRRYFWALRTTIISSAADRGKFIFASSALERESGIYGLGTLIDARDHANFEDCVVFGEQVLKTAGSLPNLNGQELRERLVSLGGIARDSVRIVEEPEAIEDQGLTAYL